MTAEEFLIDKYSCIYEKQCEGFKKLPKSRFLEMHITGRINGTEQNVLEMMIEFAKLHVEAALKAKIEAMEEYMNDGYSLDEIDSFTYNAYPLDNIK
jgi:hypothetical protein